MIINLTKPVKDHYLHCYSNIELCNGKFVLSIKNRANGCVVFGVTPNNLYEGEDLYKIDTTKGISMDSEGLCGYTLSPNIKRGRKIKPNRTYEIHFNMSPRGQTGSTMTLMYDNTNFVVIDDLASPSYFFVELCEEGSCMIFESVVITNKGSN